MLADNPKFCIPAIAIALRVGAAEVWTPIQYLTPFLNVNAMVFPTNVAVAVLRFAVMAKRVVGHPVVGSDA